MCKESRKKMEILYNAPSFVVCSKPHSMSSEETGKNSLPLLLKETLGITEIYTVHRLDTVTSGVMVYAKTKEAAAQLTRQIGDGSFTKEYLAVVHGIMEEKQAVLEDLLFKDSRKNKSFVVKRQRKGVKKASLEYEAVEEKNGLSLVKIKLHTGRTHQIRVQFSSRRHPVYGDGKYGASDNIPFIALFSHRISFISPENGERVSFEAPRPHYDFFDL